MRPNPTHRPPTPAAASADPVSTTAPPDPSSLVTDRTADGQTSSYRAGPFARWADALRQAHRSGVPF